jgi:glucosamine-6-phosphate deaminase
MSRAGAENLIDIIQRNPACTLGLATGSTPIGMYQLLVKAYQAGEISFRHVKTVNLDEYIGLGEQDEQSYVYFMRKHLFEQVDIDLHNTHLPNGLAQDGQAECQRYTALLQTLPRDIQVLGLGSDGHIGFNEPFAPFNGHTHITHLTESTIRDNARLFSSIDEVPKCAITMGIADIMQAKQILLLASGSAKAQALARMVKGAVSEDCPASILQQHPNVLVIADPLASSLL